MKTIVKRDELKLAYDKSTKHETPFTFFSTPRNQGWAQHCEINGFDAKIYYILNIEEADIDEVHATQWDADAFWKHEMPWDIDHIWKITIAEEGDGYAEL